MNNHYPIRVANAADAAATATIIRTAFAEQATLDPPSSAVRETEASVRNRLEAGTIALAEFAGSPVGCVYYEPQNDQFYFGRLAVLPRYRNQGIASALIAHAEQKARTRGFQRIRCGVRVALPRQRAHYERLGYKFVEARMHEGYNQPTWVILEKLLDQVTK